MIFLTIPHFEQQVHEALKPRLKKSPYCIIRNEKAFVFNQPAQSIGVQVGMKVPLIRKQFPQCAVEKERKRQYQAFSKQLKKIIIKHATISDLTSNGSALIDTQHLTDMQSEALCYELMRAIFSELECTVRIGYGRTKIIAYAAADCASPAQPMFISQHVEKTFFHSLPLHFLPGIGKRTVAVLFGMGIRTMGDFASLPLPFLASLFGDSAYSLRAAAGGQQAIIEFENTKKRSIAKTQSHFSFAQIKLAATSSLAMS